MSHAFAADLYCEVMAVEGTVTVTNEDGESKPLEDGDLLTVDDVIQTSTDSYVDLAYDTEWQNITRVEENSTVRIRALEPVEVGLEGGGVFAKLKALPKDSTFDVQTPTAIASVRGTEYRTTYLAGQTEVENVSDSDVLVYGFDEAGQKHAEPVVVRNSEKTNVIQRGHKPGPPRRMQPQELARAQQFRERIEEKVRHNVERGRMGNMRGASAAERFHEQRLKGGMQRQDARPGGDRPGQPRTLSGEEAGEAARRVHGGQPGEREGSGEARREGGALVSGEGMKDRENRPHQARQGLAEPYFPSGERQRSGGPEPNSLGDERWKSGAEPREQSQRTSERKETRPIQEGQKRPQQTKSNQPNKQQARPAARPRNQR